MVDTRWDRSDRDRTYENKAKFTGYEEENSYWSTIKEFEYRGQTYEVEYNHCPSYLNGLNPEEEHREKQAEIDKQIAFEESEAKRPHRYEDTADYALDQFFKYING